MRRRQVETSVASPPRYPGVEKTVEGATPQNSNEDKRKGVFEAIVLVPVEGNLTREVPTPPLGDPWDRYDP